MPEAGSCTNKKLNKIPLPVLSDFYLSGFCVRLCFCTGLRHWITMIIQAHISPAKELYWQHPVGLYAGERVT